MTKPELEDARTLWKMFYAQKTFEHVDKTCSFIGEQNFATSHPAYYSLITSVYVLYGRPFRNSRPVGKLSDEIVPLEHKPTHDTLLAHRDQIYAHADGKAFDLDVYGNVNQVRFLVTHGEFRLFATQFRARPIALPPISALCKALQDKTSYHLDRLQRKYQRSIPSKPGEYVLNIENETLPFVSQAEPFFPTDV